MRRERLGRHVVSDREKSASASRESASASRESGGASRKSSGAGRKSADDRCVQVSVHGSVAEVTIDRQDKLNALNAAVRRELSQAFDALADDDRVKVAILHGAGAKAFVAGADVAEFAARTPAQQRELYKERRVYDALAEFPKPAICAIHGFCIGGGNELALACDIRVADATARFGQFEIRLGLIPGAGGTQRLARLTGPGQAMRMALCGDLVDAEEAHRIGLVEFLVEEGRHLEKARELAARMVRWRRDGPGRRPRGGAGAPSPVHAVPEPGRRDEAPPRTVW